ncbi:MAG: T9SS type A sorting domain-containing protein [Bacteroidetes bacterium]|nr:MAG: T9SS type A sorting domain-containing protein [Bacteroidota bacterium]
MFSGLTMKTEKIILKTTLIIILISLISGISFGQQKYLLSVENSSHLNFYDMQKAFNNYWDQIPESERKGWKNFKRWESFWERRVYPTGEFPDGAKILKEWQQFKMKNEQNSTQSEAQWNLLGPVLNPQSAGNTRDQGLGRINRLRLDPTNENVLWAGAASGGVWKSVDGGRNWFTFPFTQFLSIGVSDIAIAERNPDIVYVATGDCEPSYSNYYSIGLIKTTNGGKDWEVTNLKYSTDNGRNVNRVIVHPDNPNIVIVGTSEGIYKSTDGGNTWSQKEGGKFFIDLEFMPGNPDVVYASTKSWSGNNYIYKSTNNGDTWKEIRTYQGSVRIALAVTPFEPLFVYAVVASTNRGFQSLSVSVDGGDNWDIVSTPSTSKNILGWGDGGPNDQVDGSYGQGEYDLCIAVSPSNGYEVYVGGINVWKSADGGNSFTLMTHWYGGYQKPFIHADIHDLVFANTTNTLYATHDGGIDKTTNGGFNWTNITDGMSISQFYRLGCSQTNPGLIIGGCQDNGTRRLKNDTWMGVYAGDGMEAAIDPTNENRMYASTQYGELARSGNGGSNFSYMIGRNETGARGDWITPFIINPVNTSNLYAGYRDVWKLSNYGTIKSKISNFGSSQNILSLAIAPSDTNTLYAATISDLHVTRDGAQTWTKRFYSGGPISYIAVHPENANRLWITKSNYSAGQKVFEYDGSSWKNISGNLPNVPVNCIVYQKGSPDRLYVGTDIGVFYTDYGSSYWEPYGSGMPNVIVYELEIQESSKKLRAATFGRGIWETDLMDCNLPQPQVNVIGETTFCEGDSVLLEAPDGLSDYVWSTGESTKRISIKQSGNYTLLVNDPNGCKAKSKAVEITVKKVNELNISPLGKYPICDGDTVQLSASLGFQTYLWSTGETTKKITARDTGFYSVKGTTSSGCTAFAEFKVELTPAKPIITRNRNTLTSSEAAAYQWYYNGNPIPDATQQSYEITQAGIYKIIVFDKDSCTNVSDSIDAIVGVDEIKYYDNSVIVHPNPGMGLYNVNIWLQQPNSIEMSLTNLIGVEVWSYSTDYQSGEIIKEINIQNLPDGVYYLTVKFGSQRIIQKIVKE